MVAQKSIMMILVVNIAPLNWVHECAESHVDLCPDRDGSWRVRDQVSATSA